MTPGEEAGAMMERTASRRGRCVIVIPTLNEASSIETVLDGVTSALRDQPYETFTLVVDGRSTDGTYEVAKRKASFVIRQKRKGYGDALRSGFLHARKALGADLLVMMDGDLTYDPRDIPSLLRPIIDDESDMVIGNRFLKMQKGAMSTTNRMGNRFLSWIVRGTLGTEVHDSQCGMRALRADLIDALDLGTEGMPFATELLAEAQFAGARITEIPISYGVRTGRTKLSPLRDGLNIFGTIVRLVRDTRPLFFFGFLGLVMGLLGLYFGLDVILEYSRSGTVTKIPSAILAALMLIGSFQFITLGLVADMIRRLRRRKY
ncbi:MAG: glycosyltransferase [Thaumarchaeota archaeon]|nr:glycosyltransferase [Nitrososphaerota archaeon]